jgi:uncharacterized membrane protein YtjA (UPF0391 family)
VLERAVSTNVTRGIERDGAKEAIMLGWALVFLIVALVAGMLGFTGIAGASAGMAKILFWVFLLVFLLSLVLRGRPRGV